MGLEVKIVVTDEEVFRDDSIGERICSLASLCSQDIENSTINQAYTISFDG